MAKQLNVNLALSADTSKAKAQLKELQTELTKLASATTISTFNNADMEQAVAAAKSLQTHLNNAVNVNTGRLDLSRFSKSLKGANQSLESLRRDLSLAGEQGNQAFLQLARSISQAEAPAIRISNTFREMGNTLKNTVRWQLSSSMLHGFMGAVQSAYGYAKDLDESLNNIRIVTGQSKEEMAKFAEQANKAAKALSTTTTAYTNAALIYYQQGDDDKTVLEKTDVTAKMANVTGQSAEVVSDQLTAIWNNFNKSGEESYEKYADILTALGAATASSTDEIAGGLEKFASIADMIGLSYEYAASALATITAKTRQSEDVVGTALKTIFARIQGLSLGETLEDGTDLNKYSEALMKVGISIKDQNGQLKDMDDVLTEMGSKWKTLSKDQQVALAQTVAGVRQYNQLVSLMDNWDFMQENLAIAEGAEGTLATQADIYAQSWEAASKRVQAATEDVFDSIIDSDFFIALTNGTADFISGIGDVVDAMGGMKGIITLVGSIFLTNFSKEIPSAIQKLTENFNVFTGKAQKDAIAMMEQNQAALKSFTSDNMTNALDAELTALTKVNEMKTSLAKTSHILTEAERQQFEQEIQMVEAAGQLVAKEGEKVDAIEKEIAANQRRLAQSTAQANANNESAAKNYGKSNFNQGKDQAQEIQNYLGQLKQATQAYVECEQVVKRLKEANDTWLSSGEVSAKSMKKDLKVLQQSFAETVKNGPKALQHAAKGISESFEKELEEAGDDVEKLKAVYEKFKGQITDAVEGNAFDSLEKSIYRLEQKLRGLGVNNEALNNLEQQFREGAISAEEYRQKLLALQNTESQSVVHATKMSETIGFIGAKMMQVSMAANTLKQAWNIWNDEDATLGEKILTTMTALGTVIPLVTAATNADNAAQMINHALNIANLGVKSKIPIVSKLCAAASAGLAAAKAGETGAVAANTAAWASNPIGWIAFAIMGVIAAITLLIAGIKKVTELLIKGKKIETENCEQLIENAEKTKELASANEDLSSSMEDLIEEYKEMNAEGENTSEILSQITSKMPQLIKSYKDLAETFGDPKFTEGVNELERLGNLANLTGDYSEFEKKKEELDREVAIKTAASAKSGAVAANTVLAAKMQETNGKVSGKSYSLRADGADTIGEEKKAQKILLNTMNSGDKKYATSDPGMFKYGVKVGVSDYSDPLEMVDYYEKMQKARDEMLNTMSAKELEKSDIFREINETLAATASEYQAAKEQADEYLSVAGKAAEASMGSTKDIDTMEEYLEYKEKFIQVATKEYNLTQDQAESYLKSIDGLKGLSNQYELASIMAEKFGGVNTNSKEFKNVANEYYRYMSEAFGDLSDEEIEIAVAIAGTTESIEEFAQELQLRMVQATQAGASASADLASQAMKDSLDKNEINFSKLFMDDNFLEYLEAQQISQQALLSASYEEQYRIVSGFHGAMNELAFESFTTQQELYYQQAADLQKQSANYHKAMKENSEAVTEAKKKYADFQTQLSNTTDEGKIKNIKDQMKDLADQFEENYGFEITSNAESFQNELDQILATIEQIQDKKIELAMDWSGVDELESGLKRASDFTKMVKNDAKKVGDTYQMTAAQAREWLEFYPELGAIAEVTTDGLIAMDVDKVNNFLNGKESELDGSVQTEIEKLKVEREGLQAELEIRKADLKSAEALAQGKLDLENTSAEYLTTLRSNLTQYYMDLGLDEVAANAAALETMNMNEEEYSQAVANACETNATNVGQSAEDGANAQVDALGQLVQKWQNFGSYLINNIGPILKDIGLAILDPTKSVKDVMLGAWNASGGVSVSTKGSYTAASGDYTFKSGDTTQITAALKSVSMPQLDAANAAITELENAISAIDGKISYLNALGTQDLEFLGSTDPDDVDGTTKDSKAKDLEELTEILERYHEINQEIKTQERLIDRLSKAKNRAYGEDKIALMDQEIAATEKLIEKQEDLFTAQSGFLALDKQAIIDKFHLTEQDFDEYGNIVNYTELLRPAAEAVQAAKEAYNANQTDANKKAIEDAEKEYDRQVELLSKYEDTLEAWHDQADVLTDLRNQIQDLNYEKLQEALNLKIEVDEDSLRRLELILKRFGDNFYKMAETAAILGNDKIDNAKSQLGTYKDHKSSLDDAYSKGEISQADYMTGIKEVRDGIYSQIEALIDLDDQMMHYYEDTLAAANEELADYTDHMEHLTGVFDHYLSLMDILGKSKDYDAMGNFLGGKAETLRNRLDVAKEYYNVLVKQKDEAEAKLNAAIASGDEAAIELYKNEWDAAVDAVDEAQEEMLSLTEEWAEAMKAVVENNMAKLSDTLEKSLTNGLGFDKLMDDYDKLNTRQEEFLTKTNQIYETNKLMRTANKALNDTESKAAKQKLQNFINETKSLQENTQLSKYELEIQQAKYDLLVAELELEEAKNAKSTVRLSRDSEGNYGYVYTADQDKIADAEQAVMDKENELYNLSLEGQQKYTEKYLQAQQEMFGDLDELWRLYYEDGAIDQDEYNRRYQEIWNHYYGDDGVLTTYSRLYNVGVQADADATADNWQTNYGNMTQRTEEWAGYVNGYYQGVQGQIQEWASVQTQANEDVSGALDDSKKATEDLVTESQNLKTTITEEVIPAIEDELEAVAAQTAAYAAQRTEIQGLIEDYMAYLETLNTQVNKANVGFDKDTDYSAVMNEYLNNGGRVGDATYTELLRQRDAKVEWLKSQGKDASYWGTSGAETTAMYTALQAGGSYTTSSGKTMTQDWYTDNYIEDEDLAQVLESLGVPLGALEQSVNNVKEATDTVTTKLGEINESTNAKIDEANESTTSKIGETNESINAKLGETNESTNAKISETNESIGTKISEASEKVTSALADNKDATKSAADTLSNQMEANTNHIANNINAAANQISSSVGGAISSLNSKISTLESQVSSLKGATAGALIGSAAGPLGSLVGSALGSMIAKFDTGGYTGDWGPEGRLAVVHEKEMILNASQTERFFDVATKLADISGKIDQNALSSTQGLGSLLSQSMISPGGQTLEQKVHIEASFPNVSDKSQIEEAFGNLINLASQYANRKF